MDIVIDLSSIADFFNQPVEVIFTKIFFYFGWIPLAFVFLFGVWQLWVFYRQTLWYDRNFVMIVLAIDVPRGNEQSPMAVENLLLYLAGTHGTFNLLEKYWEGRVQLCTTLEIISIEGYTQFVIHTPAKFKDLVESAVYAQYPDAEITEIDDYTNDFKGMKFPNEEYDIWGTEFIHDNKDAYPIRTYKEFEHSFGRPETQFKDPMASLMDLSSSLGKGEQLWFQIILKPIGFDWMDGLDEEANKILKEKKISKQNFLNKGADLALGGINAIGNAALGSSSSSETIEKKEEDDSLRMLNLKPKQRKQVEAIHEKTAKMGFKFKIRMIYLAKKEVMNKPKVMSGFVGFMKQFKSMDLNGFKPDLDRTGTTSAYFFQKKHLNRKKNRILKNYIKRSATAGRKTTILNVEEIATVWHFPLDASVKAPLVQKTPGKKAEAPMSLPKGEETVSGETAEPMFLEEDKIDSKKSSIEINKFDVSETEEKENKEDASAGSAQGEKEEEDSGVSGTPPSNLPIG